MEEKYFYKNGVWCNGRHTFLQELQMVNGRQSLTRINYDIHKVDFNKFQ